MGFRFLHIADLHLETNFGGRPRTRERLRRATLEAFDRAITFALENDLHAVLAAGDLFDDPLLSLRTEIELVRQVKRLSDGGVRFLLACGNHDPGGQRFRVASLGLERLPGVHVFRGTQPEALRVTDREGQPQGIVVGAGHIAVNDGANLAAAFPSAEGAIAGSDPLPVVGLLHTHVESAKAAASHDRYAPSTPEDYHRLSIGQGYSYWALGHIHTRQRAVEGLPVFYAGNLQGRHARETGEKGGLVVEAHVGAAAEPDFVRFAPVRWVRSIVADLPSEVPHNILADHLSQRIDSLRVSADEEIVVRLVLEGATSFARTLRDAEALGGLAAELAARTGALEVELRSERVTIPLDREALRSAPTVLNQALGILDLATSDDGLLRELAPKILATPLRDETEQIAYLRELLRDLPEELIERSLRSEPVTEPGSS